MKQRYVNILEPTDTWAIFDNLMDEPACLDDRLLIGLSKQEAEKLCAALNMREKEQKKQSVA